LDDRIGVRQARESELATAAHHYFGMRRELGWNDAALAGDWIAQFVRSYARAATAGDLCYFVAQSDGILIGSAVAMLKRSLSDSYENSPRCGYLANVYVEKLYRRRGAARALTQTAIEWLRANGCGIVRLQASPAGQRLYESMGFIRTHEMELAL
jgi:GNAT superfamily N-acetyltransferase